LQILSTPIYSLHYLFFYWLMTHFFLHGWWASPETEKNKIFFQAITETGNKILIVPFSQGTEKDIVFDRYVEKEFFEKWKHIIIRYNLDKNLEIECASTDIPKLIQQIHHNDILFFCWWKTYKHLEIMNKVPNLKELIQDKIVAWVSAWAIMRSKSYYSSRKDTIGEGNGFLPIKTMVHRWSSRYPWLPDKEREKRLVEYGEKLPIYKIPEQEYIEFTM
jgi:hypothetical protein